MPKILQGKLIVGESRFSAETGGRHFGGHRSTEASAADGAYLPSVGTRDRRRTIFVLLYFKVDTSLVLGQSNY